MSNVVYLIFEFYFYIINLIFSKNIVYHIICGAICSIIILTLLLTNTFNYGNIINIIIICSSLVAYPLILLITFTLTLIYWHIVFKIDKQNY